MANALLWATPATLTTYLSTELNSLASAGNKLGAAIANETARARFIGLEIAVAAQGSARVEGAHIAVYLLPALDGSTFSYGADAVDASPSNLVATAQLDASTSARTVVLPDIPIPPFDFKLLIENNTGQALAASGNTVKHRTYGEELQ